MKCLVVRFPGMAKQKVGNPNLAVISMVDFSTPSLATWGTHLVYLVPVLSYLAGSESVSANPSDPIMMTKTALESIASSSGEDRRKWGEFCDFT